MKRIEWNVPELQSMKKYPETLYYRGNTALLSGPKVSIVGTRTPNPYTRIMTYELAKKLALNGMCVVSGAAIGVDRIAHEGAGAERTIAVMPCGIDLFYPAENRRIIASIAESGLLISQFEPGFRAREWSFVVRNEVVVALGDVLIVTEADFGSGSMRSVEFALAMNKPIYVLPHRLGESGATRRLLAEGKATAIDDIDRFVAFVSKQSHRVMNDTPFIAFCRTMPTYEEAVARFGDEVFGAELSGAIEVKNGRVVVRE